ncbi:hypothetical protein BZA05DRAFT_401716 [Tricharina praecox]|uniref:uncharacterized protein n=1 Tax=Tricharina praecox TaxID=43433 RepID=UPI00221EEAB8|nr:uncharacterized protein BZA05DRAFT_401716 [Tricharina praecox]KAI5849843.1 hypothetical protein BZA05DRAFT_401716 [Tricharina praecox]
MVIGFCRLLVFLGKLGGLLLFCTYSALLGVVVGSKEETEMEEKQEEVVVEEQVEDALVIGSLQSINKVSARHITT